MAPLDLRSHSCPSPISTSGSERTQLVRIPDLTDLCANSSGSQSFLPPYLASDDNVSSLSPHVTLITHIWISEVLGHQGNGLLISNGTTVSTTEIRTLQWQPHSSSHFWLISTTLCRTPALQRRSITCPSPCAQANPCSKGCSVTSAARLIWFKSKCLLRFHWAIRGQIWHPLLLSLSHFSTDILEVLGEFQVVTCNLAARSQGLLSADKAATSQGKADSCRSKEPLKPLLNHLILLLVPLWISFFLGEGGGRKQMQGNSVHTWISKICWICSKSITAPVVAASSCIMEWDKNWLSHWSLWGHLLPLYGRPWTPRSCRTMPTLSIPFLSSPKNNKS